MGCGSSRSAAAVGVMPRQATDSKPFTSSHPLAIPDDKSAITEPTGTGLVHNTPERVKNVTGGVERDTKCAFAVASAETEPRMCSAISTKSCGGQSTDSGLGEEPHHVGGGQSGSKAKEVVTLSHEYETQPLVVENAQPSLPSELQIQRKIITLSKRVPLPPISTEPNADPEASTASKSHTKVRFSDQEDTLSIPEAPNVIKRPCSRGGLAFDILLGGTLEDVTYSPDEDMKRERKKPATIRRLEKRGEIVTLHQWEEKHRAVTERRKENKQNILERIRAQHEKERQIQEALTKFAASQDEKTQQSKAAATVDGGQLLPARSSQAKATVTRRKQLNSVRGTKVTTPLKPPRAHPSKVFS